MKQMKQKLIPAVMEELKSVDLPSFKDEIDAGKFGKIEFGLSDVLLKNINIPLESVRYSSHSISLIYVVFHLQDLQLLLFGRISRLFINEISGLMFLQV